MARPPWWNPATTKSGRAWRPVALAVVAVALASVIPYAPVVNGGFTQDDHPIVEQNPVVRSGDLAAVFGSDYWPGAAPGEQSGLYRPVTILTFLLERDREGNVHPSGAHRVSIGLHALASLALLLLARRLGASWAAAGAAGLLFAVHPVHAAAVSGLVGRADVLAALFALGALLAHTAAGPWGAAQRRWLGVAAPWLSAVLVFLALGSKESAIVVPLLLLSLDVFFRPPGRGAVARWIGARALALVPTALASLAFLALRARALRSLLAVPPVRMSDNPLVALHGVERIGTALGLAGRAVGLLILPVRLTPDYSGTAIPKETAIGSWLPLAGLVALGIFVAVALVPATIRSMRATLPPAVAGPVRRSAFAALLFLLSYLVVGNLLWPIGVIFAERLLYLPSAGFCLLVPFAAEAVLAMRRVSAPVPRPVAATLAALLAIALLGGAVRTARASGEWTSDERLWEAAVRSMPASPRAQFSLGKIRADQGRDAEAFELLDRATRLWPTFTSAWYEKGRLFAKHGDLPRAAEAFQIAIDQKPGHEGAIVGLGTTLDRLGRRDDAVRMLKQARRRYPQSAKIAETLGDVLLAAGRFREAADAYRRGAALGRPDLEARARDALSRLPS